MTRENILIYEVEEDKEDNHDEEKVFLTIADEHEIDLQPNDIQRVHRLGRKRRNKENQRPIIARFVSYKKTKRVYYQQKGFQKYRRQTARICLLGSHISTVQTTEVHAKILF